MWKREENDVSLSPSMTKGLDLVSIAALSTQDILQPGAVHAAQHSDRQPQGGHTHTDSWPTPDLFQAPPPI